MLTVDVEEGHQGRCDGRARPPPWRMQDMQPDGKGRVRLRYRIPARGLIGFQGEFLTPSPAAPASPTTCSTTTARWPAP